MRFPLRLTADLTLGLAARSLRLKRQHPLILNLAAGGNASSSKSPIVWIGGREPLDLPETPRVVNFLAAAGRQVFLPTTGLLLRRRIHEFQPSQRLHLTIRFDGAETSHDQRVGQGAFRDALVAFAGFDDTRVAAVQQLEQVVLRLRVGPKVADE